MKNIIIIVVISLSATFLTYFCVSNISLIYNLPADTVAMRGFPNHFIVDYTSNDTKDSINQAFTINGFLIDFLFFLAVAFSLYYFFFILKGNKKYIFALVLSIFFMISFVPNDGCFNGFPMAFINACNGSPTSLSNNTPIVLIDYIFWLCITITLLSGMITISKFKYCLNYILAPLFLTLIGFVIYNQCTGWFCFFADGIGFPLSFYDKDGFIAHGFIVDYMFFAFGYLGIFMAYKAIRNSMNESTIKK